MLYLSQVGSNTMNNSNDPLLSMLDRYEAFKKVFVEPVPPLFDQLQKNMAHLSDTTFVNVAISTDGKGVCCVASFASLELQQATTNGTHQLGTFGTDMQREGKRRCTVLTWMRTDLQQMKSCLTGQIRFVPWILLIWRNISKMLRCFGSEYIQISDTG